ncbi:hypothetical protein K458DRAFT_50465 [Lentithecium fluviatile CBS 122367]|uniref:Uncharacterized protein n=1 Tax=Lentithecium fluviatile CBS 122367 TaxID=1168545 RepID=A0A6G1IXV7_9PLEO|nr:hypothetical protein K458DRAFT_50465 [Lentithecium fluviatile CBS 122367]
MSSPALLPPLRAHSSGRRWAGCCVLSRRSVSDVAQQPLIGCACEIMCRELPSCECNNDTQRLVGKSRCYSQHARLRVSPHGLRPNIRVRRRGSDAESHAAQGQLFARPRPWFLTVARVVLDSSMSANSDDAIPNSAQLPERRTRGSEDPTATMTSGGWTACTKQPPVRNRSGIDERPRAIAETAGSFVNYSSMPRPRRDRA